MGWLQDFKQRAGWYFFNREAEQERTVNTRNLEVATRVGLIFNVATESDFVLVKQYRKHLQNEYGIKQVEGLGWIQSKETPDYTTLHRGFSFINLQQVNWYFKPQSNTYDEFINLPFDILIDLTFEPILPLRFALKKSKATLKVGRYSASDYDLYDLTLNLDPGALLDEYLKQVERYLRVLKETK